MLGSTFANDIAKLIFTAVAIANIADDAATSPLTDLQFSLHTDNPGIGGDQTTNEAAYTGYARVAVARSGSGFTVTGNDVVNAAEILFGLCTGADEVITHVAVGTASSGTGKILGLLALGANLGAMVGEADDETLTIKNHGLSVSDRVSFYAQEGQALPTGLTQGQLYFVKTAPSVDTITVATTDGGATVLLTADGGGRAFSGVPLSVTASPAITPRIAAGAASFSFN